MAVMMMQAIDVPKARWTTCSNGTDCQRKRLVRIGTIMPPPPIPNKPAKKPTTTPNSKSANINSIDIIDVTVDLSSPAENISTAKLISMR